MKTKKQPDLRTRLATAAKQLGLRMPQVQLLLAQERFLFRLAAADEDKKLIWKGGSLILRRYSQMKPPRFTSDVDLLARGLDIAQAEEVIREAMELDLEDGFQFFDIKRTPMERDTPYGGERFEIAWKFQGKQNSEPLRIDLCAGDDVDPERIPLNDIYLLDDDSSAATFQVYPPEFIIAEKVETMVRFGTGNTRLKDFIDIWTLAQMTPAGLDLEKCKKAIERCFTRRSTTLDPAAWNAVLADEEFQELMEHARKRNFPKLAVPPVPKLFSVIQEFLAKLRLE